MPPLSSVLISFSIPAFYSILYDSGGHKMGFVNAEITLKNVKDMVIAEAGLIKDAEIRQETVTARVDTGAISLVINEKLRLQLGLGIQGERQATLADNTKTTVKIADPVNVCWKNRDTICRPLVVSDGKIRLGVAALEDMDLMVDPIRQELTGVHGDEVISELS
jgi:clan AA aspartic protease